jgi:hypothetical protein
MSLVVLASCPSYVLSAGARLCENQRSAGASGARFHCWCTCTSRLGLIVAS